MIDVTQSEAMSIWEQQPAESNKAFSGFLVYRNMTRSERSIQSASRVIYGWGSGRPIQTQGRIVEWSTKWNWVERAKAYDREQDRIDAQTKAEARRSEIDALTRRQVQQAAAFQTAYVQPAIAILRRLQLPVGDPRSVAAALDQLTVGELIRLSALTGSPWATVAKIERLALGISTENIEEHTVHSGGVNVSDQQSNQPEPDAEHFTEVLRILLEAGVSAPRDPEIIDAEIVEVHSPSTNGKTNGFHSP